MKNLKTAKRYASALMQVARKQNLIELIHGDLMDIRTLITDSADFHSLLVSPIIPEQQKKDSLSKLLSSSVHAVTMEFLLMLCSKRRENILLEIIDVYHDQFLQHQGIVHVDVTSVNDLEPAQVEALTSRLRAMTGQNPVLNFSKDPSLIAGFIVRVGDTVIDGSVKHQLLKLKEQFIIRKTF